jgi:hypothetical protein
MTSNLTMWFNSKSLIKSWNTTPENLSNEVSTSPDDVKDYSWDIIQRTNCILIDNQLYIQLPEKVNHNPGRNGKLLLPVDNFKIIIPEKVRDIIKTSSDRGDKYIQYKTVTEYVNGTEQEWKWEQLFAHDRLLKKQLKSQESRNAKTEEWTNLLFNEAFVRSTYTFPSYRSLSGSYFCYRGHGAYAWLDDKDWFRAGFLYLSKWDSEAYDHWDNKSYGHSVRWVKDSSMIFDRK